ncbi:hypothetical protein AB9F37_33255, partial [Rhizobium leguminosarum]
TQAVSFPIAYGPELNKYLELALFAAKIGAYAQGFAVMAEASREFNWSLPMPTIARIWRAGCIIRSPFPCPGDRRRNRSAPRSAPAPAG